MTCGIYVIEHTKSGRKYVGSSCDIERRWREHRRALSCGRHHSLSLQRSWAKYGESAFCFAVIEQCVEGDLLEKEQQWFHEIKPFAASHSGFNENPTAAKPPPSNIQSKESRLLAGWKGPRGPMSDGQKAKVSASKMGQKLNYTPESIAQRQAAAWASRRANGTAKHSEETKAKLSAVRKANPTKPFEIFVTVDGSKLTLRDYAARNAISYSAAYWRYRHDKF